MAVNKRSALKQQRHRFCHFLKLVEKKSKEQNDYSSSEEDDEEIDEAKPSQSAGIKRRLRSHSKDKSELSSPNKQFTKGTARKRSNASVDKKARGQSRAQSSETDKYIDCDSDVSGVESNETYWLENEVVFVPASERKTPLEFTVKRKID